MKEGVEHDANASILRNEEEADRWLRGGGPETIGDILQIRKDDFLVAEITANHNDQAVGDIPGEPEGRPKNSHSQRPERPFLTALLNNEAQVTITAIRDSNEQFSREELGGPPKAGSFA